GLVIRSSPALTTRLHGDVQPFLRDIHSHKHRARHRSSLRAARRDPTLHDAGLRPRPTVRTLDERGERATPRLTDGLEDPRRRGLSPAPTCSHFREESRYKAAAMYRILFVLTALLVPTPLVGQRLAPVPSYGPFSLVVSPRASGLGRLRTDSAI